MNTSKCASPQEMMKLIRWISIVTSRRSVVHGRMCLDDLVREIHYKSKGIGQRHISPWER